MNRRNFLKGLAGAGAAVAASNPMFRAMAAPDVASDEFFIMIHAQGAWDVTVGLDPRNQRVGLIEPASTNTVNEQSVRRWTSLATPLDGANATSGYSFELVRPAGNSPLVFGPAIGDLLRHSSRLTVINGISMATVAHPDGTAYSATGRHLAGSKPVASSIDTMMADSLGGGQLLPVVSVGYPSYFVGGLDRRVVPLTIASVGTLASSLRRTTSYWSADQRDAITAVLSQEAQDLAVMSADQDVMNGLYLQYEAVRRMNKQSLLQAFDSTYLKATYAKFNFALSLNTSIATNAAFALEMLKRNVVRCVSFGYGSYDTHFSSNYVNQPLLQQNLFDSIAVLLDYLDQTPHPTKTGAKLADTTHIMVISDFCRTPQINVNGGRDHYPNNSCLIISPRFKGNFVFGQSDPEQLLPLPAKTFADGSRPIAPPDILRTFVSAFGADPARYLRDGEVVKELLR